MAYETITWQVDDDGVALLTLNRPEQLNAFTFEMAYELLHVFEHAAQDDSVRAVVVTGEGRAFCAGMELNSAGDDATEDAQHTSPAEDAAARSIAVRKSGNVYGVSDSVEFTTEEFYEAYEEPPFDDGVRDLGGKLTLAINALPKPVIAAINGAAVGIGATMTLAMDVRLASTKAKIGFVFGRLGIVPEAASTWFLPRIVGMQQALEWVYSADILTAEQVRDGRLVRSVHEPDELLDAAMTLARSFVVHRSPVAVGLTKQLMYRNSGVSTPLEAHLADSLAMFHTTNGDGIEGVAAFLEKRDPKFTVSVSEIPEVFRPGT